MRLTLEQLRAWDHRRVTLLGMSGVGKTRLANLLRQAGWFHYSGDYRIGTRYLDEPILDHIKCQAMRVPFLRELLRSDSIYIRNNLSVDNLQPVSSFMGKLGNPERGGLPLTEFKRRQALHHEAEVAAMRDVVSFIGKAREIYGYRHFVNDAGGSLCEVQAPGLMERLAEHTLILYIQATHEDEEALLARAQADPKPLYYRPEFLEEQLAIFMRERELDYVALIDPDELARWVFPRLFRARIPRYEAIAADHGYTITTGELAAVRDEADLVALLEQAVARGR